MHPFRHKGMDNRPGRKRGSHPHLNPKEGKRPELIFQIPDAARTHTHQSGIRSPLGQNAETPPGLHPAWGNGRNNRLQQRSVATHRSFHPSQRQPHYPDALHHRNPQGRVDLAPRCGCRPFERRTKVLGKRNKERIIPFGSELAEAINHYRAIRARDTGHTRPETFFIRPNGEPLYPMLVERIVKQALTGHTAASRSPHTLSATLSPQTC